MCGACSYRPLFPFVGADPHGATLRGPVKLAGTKIVLREFRLDDEDDALGVVGDDEVTVWLSHDSRDREQARAMLTGAMQRAQADPRVEYYLAIALPDSDRLIGFVRIGLDGVKAGKLGYAVRRDEWGKGYATDAARTMMDFGFRDLGLRRISAAIGPDNAASIAVAKRLGFRYEGRIRDHVFTNGAWRDSLLYSVLERDWPRARFIGAWPACGGSRHAALVREALSWMSRRPGLLRLSLDGGGWRRRGCGGGWR